MEYLPIVLSIVAVAITFYYYCVRGLDYFKKHGILHIPPLPLVGNTGQMFLQRKPMSEVVKETYDLHPDAKYVGMFDFMNPVIMIRDPDLIKTIAIKHFDSFQDHRTFVDESQDPYFGKNLFALRGSKWKDIRNLLSPAFTASKMKTMFDLMSNCAADYGNFLAKLPKEKTTIELKDTFTRYTNDVIATCAFGMSVNSIKYPNNDFYVNGKMATTFSTYQVLKAFVLRSCPNFTKMLKVRLLDNRVTSYFSEAIRSTINQRDEKGISRPDMLQLMMESRGKRGDNELSIEDMTAQAFIFFFGGFDTVSTAMCFTGYELAVNREVHDKLQNEIDEVLEKTDGRFTYEAVTQMEYLDAVINEALRKYPLISMMDRVCNNQIELPPALPGDKPFIVKEGMSVWFPSHGLHHDPKYFDNPEIFDPDRFLKDGKKYINSGFYVPFGMGPRMCIGNRFALMEMKVLFCNLLARCNLRISEKTQIPLKLKSVGFSLMAKDGYFVKIEPRDNAHPALAASMSNGKATA